MYARAVSPLEKNWLDDISPNLYKQLMGFTQAEPAKLSKKEEREASSKVQKAQESNATVTVYRKTYPTVLLNHKKDKIMAMIPLEDLPFLAQANEKAPKRPKNFLSTLLFRGFYIHYADKFFSILELNGKIDTTKGILDNPPSGVFTVEDNKLLVDNLTWILALCKSKKERKRLGFVMLDQSGDGNFRFAFNNDCFDALDTSLYSLLQLSEAFEAVGNVQLAVEVGKLYGKLLKLVE
jgi:hypothetical protein